MAKKGPGAMAAELIELDDRGRAPLRKYASPRERYLVEVDEDGVIRLYPAAVMTGRPGTPEAVPKCKAASPAN
jgi:hypothetical protein